MPVRHGLGPAKRACGLSPAFARPAACYGTKRGYPSAARACKPAFSAIALKARYCIGGLAHI